MYEGLKVGVVIPALNEEASLPKVLADMPEWIDTVIVVDNGSTDTTARVAVAGGATVVAEAERGYGAACLKGIASLPPVDVVVFCDADYSDHPQEVERHLERIVAGDDMVIGSRLTGEAEPGALLPQARFGNTLSCFLMHRFFGFRYTDLGPFRAIRREALERIQMEDRAFGWTVEMQLKAILHDLTISEVPVSYRKRIGVSKITGTIRGTILAGITILSVIFSTWWRHRGRT